MSEEYKRKSGLPTVYNWIQGWERNETKKERNQELNDVEPVMIDHF